MSLRREGPLFDTSYNDEFWRNVIKISRCKDSSTERRLMTPQEQEGAVVALTKFFNDSEEDLKEFVKKLTVVPKDFEWLVIYTKGSFIMLDKSVKNEEYKNELNYVYFSNVLGMSEADAKAYVEGIEKRIKVLGENDYKMSQFSEEERSELSMKKGRAENYEDLLMMRRDDSDELEEISKEIEELDKQIRLMDKFQENNLGDIPVRSAIAIYNSTHNTERTRG